MSKISRRIEIIAFRRRTQVAAGSNTDANSSSPDTQSGEPAISDGRSLLPEDTGVNADVVRLLKQIAASLDNQADGDE
jgi:hypothetical protein